MFSKEGMLGVPNPLFDLDKNVLIINGHGIYSFCL